MAARPWGQRDLGEGIAELQAAVAAVLSPPIRPSYAGPWPVALLAEAMVPSPQSDSRRPGSHPPATGPSGQTATTGEDPEDIELRASSEEDAHEAQRLIDLVEAARGGDTEAFGALYDHYHGAVYRFLYYRLGSVQLAEDLTSETFFRALRSMSSFRWQGKDFGAWLMTIARNLTTDHYKSSRNRLETVTDDMSAHDTATESPESAVLESLTNEALMSALRQLPTEQQECLIMRFLQGLTIAETAAVLGRSDGAVKQLQLRGVRNLARLMPEGLR